MPKGFCQDECSLWFHAYLEMMTLSGMWNANHHCNVYVAHACVVRIVLRLHSCSRMSTDPHLARLGVHVDVFYARDETIAPRMPPAACAQRVGASAHSRAREEIDGSLLPRARWEAAHAKA